MIKIQNGHYNNIKSFLDSWNIQLLPFGISFELSVANIIKIVIKANFTLELSNSMTKLFGLVENIINKTIISKTIVDSSIGQSNFRITCSATKNRIIGNIVFSLSESMFQLRSPIKAVCKKSIYKRIVFNIINLHEERIPLSHGKIGITGEIIIK